MQVDLPEGVLDVVGRRLSRLSPAANQAMAVAALCGLDFGVRVLREVADAGTPDAVVDGLDEGVRARLLVETGAGRFAFVHAIVRDTLTRELTVAKRARLHRAIGEAFLAVYGEGPDAPVADLARHFGEAAVLGDTASAARWATAAARVATDQADHRGAIAVLERALAVIEAVEPVDQAARFDVAAAVVERHYALAEVDAAGVGSAADAARRLGSGERLLRVAMANYFRGAGLTDQGVELFEEALELLDPTATPLRTLVLASLAWRRSLQGDPRFIDDVDAAKTLLPEIEVPAPKVAAAARLWIAFASLGLPGAADRLELCEDALAVGRDTPDPWWEQLATGIDVAGQLRVGRGVALMALGRRAEFETNLVQIRDLGEATGEGVLLILGHANVAMLALLDGRFDAVGPSADRMLDAGPDEENIRMSYFVLVGRVAIEQGRPADALALADAALSISPDLAAVYATLSALQATVGDAERAAVTLDHLLTHWSGWAREWTWPFTLASAAEAATEIEATEHAAEIAEELELYRGELVIVGLAVMCLGAFDRYRGMLLTVLGRHDEAVEALTAALGLEESIDSPPLAARTRHWLARALLRRDGPDDRQRADVELGRSIQTAEQLGMAGLAAAGREVAKTAD